MAVVRVVAMPIVQIVDVADVFERLVAAVDAVNVLVGLDVRVVLGVDRHGSTPDQVSATRQLSHPAAEDRTIPYFRGPVGSPALCPQCQ
jgi:hypothetical protein